MQLIDQRTKDIMEGCKERARDAGLKFQDETLEYIVTNRDLLELSPKIMIPTLYDFWVHDVEVLREKGKYELYPSNPYETVINTRPPISFYNDNNPDWLNVMIFYHVIGHIDFFQNNLFFRHTWDYDFTGQALSDKRIIAKLRAEKGRWVDYIIEFTRGIDNLVGYFDELAVLNRPKSHSTSSRMDYYFDVFLQSIKKVNIGEYIKEINRFNECMKQTPELGEQTFFADVTQKHPEFDALFRKHMQENGKPPFDLIQYLLENSEFLNKEENKWMQTVIEVIRNTSIFFQPQIRTKIMNEGWASYWHEELFLKDDRISGHEVDFARVNSGVTSMPRVGLNPYALGLRMFQYIEEIANKGKLSIEFKSLRDAQSREEFNRNTNSGRDYIFNVRENLSDFTFINTFIDQDFITRHNLFVAGKRLNPDRMVWEYYVKSRKAEDYREMIVDQLYHPPHITIDPYNTTDNTLYLIHKFEEKPLVQEYIGGVLMGIEFLWGGPVHLETHEVVSISSEQAQRYFSRFLPAKAGEDGQPESEVKWRKVLYTMKKRKLSKKAI
ncbi:SpoVR family protein [candidate division KSB1 bacterium]|nr:SpoVR family protein [candidate division KSB1 bacterium]